MRESSHPTQYWHALEDGRVQCDLCPRYCRLQEGQRGFCFVRANQGAKIVLTTYGRSSGFCIDPIEKKPLNHFYPGSSVLSFGTAGCNLGCKFCQNWDISKSREMDTLADEASPEAIAQAAQQAGCKSVAFTYNDPVIFMEYAMDVAAACKARNIQTIAVTAGVINAKPREEFYKLMDAANVDLKAFTERFYKQICSSELQAVLETLKYLKHETKTWFEITTLLIPGENDSEKEIEEETQWIVENLGPDVPLHFTAYHPDYKFTAAATPLQTLLRARQIALKNGIHYCYAGNIRDRSSASTYCSSCGKLLIGREGYDLDEWNLNSEGKCKFCLTALAGRFDAMPGNWGSKRARIDMRLFQNLNQASGARGI